MSKRGRRRNSKRRKSSSSSKQSPSPYIFQQQNHSNSISNRDDAIEKGETDSLGKENVLSGCQDQDAYSNDPPREKRYKQDYEVTSFSGDKSVFTKTTELEESGVKIVTSVSVSDIENSPTNVLCQQSYDQLSENPADSSAPVTNIFKVNLSGLQMKLEIQEAVQLKTYDMETTFVFRNENRSAEMNIKRKCERMWTPDNDSPEQPSLNVSSHKGDQSSNFTFHFGSMSEQTAAQRDPKPVCAGNIWGDPNYCQCCNDRSQRTSVDLMLTDHSSNLPFLLGSFPPAKRTESSDGDQFWDIPPPQEFADIKYNTLEDLTQDLASFRIGARSPADRQRRSYSAEPRSPFSLQVEEEEDLAPSLDHLSESDNFDPMFMRPSLSTNRSSFTRDFIYCHRRKSWIRNNSIATVEHRVCSLLKKRRQTFPGTSHGPGLMQEDLQLPYNESFSSLIMCSLPFQTERLGRNKRCNDRFSAFGNYMSSKTAKSFKPASEIPDGHRGNLLSPFYVSSSNDYPDLMLTERRRSSSRPREPDARQSLCKDEKRLVGGDGDYNADQSKLVRPDQEMREIECSSPNVLEEVIQTGLAIQVIPPSCSGSEEQILQSQTFVSIHNINSNQTDSACASPEISKSSQSQRFLQVDSSPPTSSCVENDLQTALENLCMSPAQDPDVDPSNTETSEPNPTENTDSSSFLQPMDEMKDLQVATGGASPEEFNKPAEITPSPTDDTKEALSKADKADKQVVYRSSLEAKEHLKPVFHKERDSSVSDHWAKRRKLFKESKQWSSAGGSSITSDITEESVSEDAYSTDMPVPDVEERGFYTETFHSSAWIYQGDEVCSEAIRPALTTRTRPVSIRERTVKISKGTGEYPWGFRIQFSKPIVVTEVDTNGAAEEAGLMVGDYVLAVNGIDVTSIPHSEAANLARQGPDVLTLTIGSDIARGPNKPRPPCRGYLHKRTQSGLIKGWRKRWFVLTHDCCLYYYKHKRDEGKRQAVWSVKLEGAEVGPDSSLGKPFVFKCRPQSGNRMYFLCATSNQEMKRWLDAMGKAIHPITQNHVWVDVTRHNSNLPPLAVKSPDCLGLLHKMDKTKDMWVQHYCILKDGCFYLYSGIRATHAHGGIYLQGYTVREQPYGSKKSTIELRPPSDEFKTFYLCADNPAENKRWMVAINASIKKWLPLHLALQDYMNRPPEETRM